VIESPDRQGKAYIWSYGKQSGDAAVPIEGTDGGTVVGKMSSSTVDHVWKIAGGNTRGHGVVSKDGKTMLYKQDGKDGQGHTERNVIIFDKQ
jgi:hypothetical protein